MGSRNVYILYDEFLWIPVPIAVAVAVHRKAVAIVPVMYSALAAIVHRACAAQVVSSIPTVSAVTADSQGAVVSA